MKTQTPLLDGIRKQAFYLYQLPASKFAPVIPALLGAGSGALIDKENRVRGALIGAAVGGGVGLGAKEYLKMHPNTHKKVINSLHKVDRNIDWLRRGRPKVEYAVSDAGGKEIANGLYKDLRWLLPEQSV